MTHPEAESVDVAVVGGGPVGVITALAAARRGLKSVVFEREKEIYALPRAVGMDDETQRALHGLGLGARFAAITTKLKGAEFVDVDGNRLNGFDFPEDIEWPLGHHPMVIYHQPELEALLRSAALDAGVQLHLGAEVGAVDQDIDRAWIHARMADGTAIQQPARWVVAADGAASPTRQELGIEFADAGFDQDWLVVDAALTNGEANLPPLAQQICDPARPTTFVPGHDGRRRWELQLQPGEDPEEMTRPDRVWELLEPWLSPSDATIGRAVVYRFHATVAESMRIGRVFIAGDAAHQMPPFMGQGLCSGIRDAVNLAWKLEMVADARAGDRLLESYDLERRPHAEGMVEYAADTGRLIDELSGRTPSTEGASDAGYAGMRPFPHLAAGVRSGQHDLTGRQLPQPRISGRPLDELVGSGFAIVTRDASAIPASLRKRWRALGIEVAVTGDEAPFVPLRGAVIVRPDRYVAAVAEDAAELGRRSDELLDWFESSA